MSWPRLRYGLPRDVRILQTGLVVNAFGNGAAAPFLILYLHDVRGIALPLAGAAAAVGAASALAATLVAGAVAHRLGPRPAMLGGLATSTIVYGLYPLVGHAWQAIGLAVPAGAAIGTWLTMQSTVVAAITPAAQRHLAFAWQRVAANVGQGLGGFTGGLLVTTSRPATFAALFWLNAATFIAYAAFLVRVRVPPTTRPTGAVRGDYRAVWSDRAFRRVAVLNLAIVAGAVSLLNALVPVYARNQAQVSERVIGALFLLNSLIIITLQLPVARRVEGRRRTTALALMAGLFALSWVLVAAAPAAGGPTAAVAVLVAAFGAFSLAECLYDAVQPALVAELAPPGLLSRYLAVTGFSWQLGFILGPATGALILARADRAVADRRAALCRRRRVRASAGPVVTRASPPYAAARPGVVAARSVLGS